MKIQKYTPEYDKKVKSLIRKTLLEIFGKHKVPPFEKFEEYEIFYMMLEEKDLIGTIALKFNDNKYIVKRMYVKKEYRNKGAAQKLYDTIEKYALNKKIKRLYLSTCPQMKSAINFYNKNGYKKISEDKKANSIFFMKVLK